MTSFKFEWDEAKSLRNKKKHGVSFDEAKSVFYDENALFISDPDHSEAEDRFVLLGMSAALRILVVCHCYREKGNSIRIISARCANKREFYSYSQR